MTKLIRTSSAHTDFQMLTAFLDRELGERYGNQQSFFDRFNQIGDMQHVILAYRGDQAVGCGAVKE